MSINNSISYSNLAKSISHLKNPNAQTGTILIELPADVGRAYNGYKRGGIIEGAEKFRKELMSAAVWLFGIPVFNKLGNILCEKFLKLPMDIDYSNKNKGDDSISNTINYLKNNINENKFNTSEVDKYLKNEKIMKKIKSTDADKLVKNIKSSKQVISILALIINCTLMGVVLPKVNQAITRKKLQENKKQESAFQFESFETFEQKTKKENNVSFTGLYEVADWVTSGINFDNRFRLISTDVPMIIGRCATARNKYEALEIGIMDSAAIVFYNFTQGWTEKLLRGKNTPNINAKVVEYISSRDKDALYSAIESAKNKKEIFNIFELFEKTEADEILKQGTDGKYGKINKFVTDDEIAEVSKSVRDFLKHIGEDSQIFDSKNRTVDIQALKKAVKKINTKNTSFFLAGTIVSFLGLGWLIPKVAYFITKKITGKDGFVGIQEESKSNC